MRRFSGGSHLCPIVLILLFGIPSCVFGQVSWVKNFDDALSQAAKEKKFIVLDMSASW
jgi:hypothetical protein